MTDFELFLAIDTKTQETLNTSIQELPKHFAFFLPWAGIEKAKYQDENPADVKAAEKMAKLFDEIKADNPDTSPEFTHNLNVFLSRLLFCFFAEDTNIFDKNQFTNSIASHTNADGSDLNHHFENLFLILNTPSNDRVAVSAHLEPFPYVNGGLFKDKIQSPIFTVRSRKALLESGKLDWSEINPDIFGSMIQAVITPDMRGGMGMHYTSVPNIMKVIEPLFLNELNEEFEMAKGNHKKLEKLQSRLANIKIFDPACGSGNFLIIAYKELRRLEMKIIEQVGKFNFSEISLSKFYGIELDDFAHEIAILSLWLAQHQMNVEFFKAFGQTKPTLPLTEAGNIVCGNACRLVWEEICPKQEGDEIYILGNPPFTGKKEQGKQQKIDIKLVFDNRKGYGNIDYVCIWFYKAAQYIKSSETEVAFVSTNSIIQGEQVPLLWNDLYKNGVKKFSYKTFEWKNNAKHNASVHVVIIGLTKRNYPHYIIFSQESDQSNTKKIVSNINPYLLEGGDILVSKRSKPLSNIARLNYGNMPIDNGELSLSDEEKTNLVSSFPHAEKYLKKYIGGYEFLNGTHKWCLWINKEDLEDIKDIPMLWAKIVRCEEFKKFSNRRTTNNLAATPFLFGEIRQPSSHYIIIPKVSSNRREYIPLDIIDKDTVLSGSALFINNDEIYHFGLISSKLMNVWLQCVCGRTKSDPIFSSSVVYNTFPCPPISVKQKEELTQCVYRILAEREKYPSKTLAQLYDPNKMPEGLREAHHLNDLAIERCYRSKPFTSDEERLEHLFKLYEKMIAEEAKT